jgi:transcriptional regulator GlxA family with amidase domain
MQGPSLSDGRAADSVMRAVDFVEERKGENIGVREMAEAACYSPFYFSRLFARATLPTTISCAAALRPRRPRWSAARGA